MDIVDKESRSKWMARIRSRGNRSTEVRLRMGLVRTGISGWRMHPEEIVGNPDFFFPKSRVALFVDGCFWHGCPECGHIPKSNKVYWRSKIARNIKRDTTVRSQLQRSGISPLRIWEHDLKSTEMTLRVVKDALAGRLVQRANRASVTSASHS